jgi:hypothetical protein
MKPSICFVLAAAACASPPVDPAVKADVGRAAIQVPATSSDITTALSLLDAGAFQVATLQSGQLLGDLDHLLTPFEMAGHEVDPPFFSGALPAGCLRQTTPGVLFALSFVAAPVPGCEATDHLEIDYSNGDVLTVTVTQAPLLTLSVAVTAGDWSGTSASYTPSVKRLVATLRRPAKDLDVDVPIDADLSWTETKSPSGSSFSGDTLDRVAGAHVTMEFVNDASISDSEFDNRRQTGTLRVESLDPGGPTVEWSSVDVLFQIRHDRATGFIVAFGPISATGDVRLDSKRVGVLDVDSGRIAIAYDDGSQQQLDSQFVSLALFDVPAF